MVEKIICLVNENPPLTRKIFQWLRIELLFIIGNVYWTLLCAPHCAQDFTCIIMFNPPNNPKSVMSLNTELGEMCRVCLQVPGWPGSKGPCSEPLSYTVQSASFLLLPAFLFRQKRDECSSSWRMLSYKTKRNNSPVLMHQGSREGWELEDEKGFGGI